MPLRWVRLKPLMLVSLYVVAAAGLDGVGLVSGLHWIMPNGGSAPGNSPTVPGFTGPGAGAVEGVDQGGRVGEGGGGRWFCPGGRADRRKSGRPRRACQYEPGAQHGSSHRGSTASHRADGSRRADVPSGLEWAPREEATGDSILPRGWRGVPRRHRGHRRTGWALPRPCWRSTAARLG